MTPNDIEEILHLINKHADYKMRLGSGLASAYPNRIGLTQFSEQANEIYNLICNKLWEIFNNQEVPSGTTRG